MIRTSLLVGVALAVTLVAPVAAKAPPHRPRGPYVHPAPPLAMLPSLGRIRIEAARDRLIVIQEVHLPRGEWQSGDLDLYVAFGAPGAPKAFDARVLSLPAGATWAAIDEPGEVVATERAPHRPVSAQVVIGRAQMAGAIVHLKEASFRRALAASDTAVLRVRTLLDPPAEDARVGREVVVRLGVPGEVPVTIGHLQVVSLETRPWITRAEAQLCGPEADTWPLAIELLPKPTVSAPAPTTLERGAITPRMALRHSSDDLCVRFFTQ